MLDLLDLLDRQRYLDTQARWVSRWRQAAIARSSVR